MKGGSTTAEQKGTVIPTLPGVNKCFICARTVYKMEEVIAAGQCWHLGCFNCGGNNTDGCNKRLRRDGYTVHNTQPYCPACSTKLSKLEGRNSPAAPGSENTMKISSGKIIHICTCSTSFGFIQHFLIVLAEIQFRQEASS